MIAALNLSGFEAVVDEAKTSLGAGAAKAGYPNCGDAIAWRYQLS
ncbi:hypothetical protein AB0K15_06725 [Amycolatopsis sp. NPDC049253]